MKADGSQVERGTSSAGTKATPKISYVIPCYNMEKWLPAAVESCLYQSDPEIEVVIVNDGSTDGSGELVDRYAAADSRVRAVHQENKGHGITRQTGQEHARGEFIHFLDADDFLDRHATRTMYGVAKRDNVDAVCGNAIVFSEKTLNTRKYFHHPAASNLHFSSAPRYWKSKVLWRWIYRRDVLNELNIHHPHYKMGQDVCVNFQILPQLKSFSQCPDFFYFFRQEHKAARISMEVLVEHALQHYAAAKQTLLEQGEPKALVRYLQENYHRDTKKTAKRLPDDGEHWKERWLAISLDVFEGLKPEWFTEEFLAPEVRCDRKFVPLAKALCAKDEAAAMSIFESHIPVESVATEVFRQNKSSSFHTWRRKMKSVLSPLSLKTRATLRHLKKLEEKRFR
ncbi:hypothetical protein JCM12178A_08030 [Salidesulfovibrio brasiliensis]